jgi:hypothetical protein
MFIVERSGFDLLFAMTGSLGLVLTMHIHLGPEKNKLKKPSKNMHENKLEKRSAN